MKNFDVHFLSNNIIDSKPLSTAVVTYENVYLASFRYNYFTGGFEDLDHVPYNPVIKNFFGNKYKEYQYDNLLAEMKLAVKEVLLHI